MAWVEAPKPWRCTNSQPVSKLSFPPLDFSLPFSTALPAPIFHFFLLFSPLPLLSGHSRHAIRNHIQFLNSTHPSTSNPSRTRAKYIHILIQQDPPFVSLDQHWNMANVPCNRKLMIANNGEQMSEAKPNTSTMHEVQVGDFHLGAYQDHIGTAPPIFSQVEFSINFCKTGAAIYLQYPTCIYCLCVSILPKEKKAFPNLRKEKLTIPVIHLHRLGLSYSAFQLLSNGTNDPEGEFAVLW